MMRLIFSQLFGIYNFNTKYIKYVFITLDHYKFKTTTNFDDIIDKFIEMININSCITSQVKIKSNYNLLPLFLINDIGVYILIENIYNYRDKNYYINIGAEEARPLIVKPRKERTFYKYIKELKKLLKKNIYEIDDSYLLNFLYLKEKIKNCKIINIDINNLEKSMFNFIIKFI